MFEDVDSTPCTPGGCRHATSRSSIHLALLTEGHPNCREEFCKRLSNIPHSSVLSPQPLVLGSSVLNVNFITRIIPPAYCNPHYQPTFREVTHASLDQVSRTRLLSVYSDLYCQRRVLESSLGVCSVNSARSTATNAARRPVPGCQREPAAGAKLDVARRLSRQAPRVSPEHRVRETQLVRRQRRARHWSIRQRVLPRRSSRRPNLLFAGNHDVARQRAHQLDPRRRNDSQRNV